MESSFNSNAERRDMGPLGPIKIFAGIAGTSLAADVCTHLDTELGVASVGRFADGEVKVQIGENVRGNDVFIINPLCPPAENWVEMALLIDAARRSSAGRITIVPPYLGYNRQDKKDKPRVPLSAKVMINFVDRQRPDRAILFDLHSETTAGFFNNAVVDHLYASIISVPYLFQILTEPYVVASTDDGGGAKAGAYARRLGKGDFVSFHKGRGDDGQVETVKIKGEIRGKNILFVDDMIDSGGTLIKDAEAAKEAGAEKLYAFATHGLFSGDSFRRLSESPLDEVIVTDSVGPASRIPETLRGKITVLSIAEMMARAIRRVHDAESLSDLIL